MKDMLRFVIARDTMHQQQWLAALEGMGGFNAAMPIPNSFPLSEENQEHNHDFFVTSLDGSFPEGRWKQGATFDAIGVFSVFRAQPLGEEPALSPARPDSGTQAEQIGDVSAAKGDK